MPLTTAGNTSGDVRRVSVCRLGRTNYRACWDLQRKLFDARRRNDIGDVLVLTEHEPVYTIGRTGDRLHVLAEGDELQRRNFEVVDVDRGGDVTYHGPGQLVGYPILDLRGYYCDLHRFLRDLEETVIAALAVSGIVGTRDKGLTGVWVGGEKICAMGVRVVEWTTMHGFALNVNTDLSPFERIIPCGIFHKGVTSMRDVLGKDCVVGDVEMQVARAFGAVFAAETSFVPVESLIIN